MSQYYCYNCGHDMDDHYDGNDECPCKVMIDTDGYYPVFCGCEECLPVPYESAPANSSKGPNDAEICPNCDKCNRTEECESGRREIDITNRRTGGGV